MSDKYKTHEADKAYFITMTVVGWVDIFTRKNHKMAIVDSLKFCQKEKSIGYIYTADGTKLRKYTNGSGTENTTTDYIGAYVYEESELEFIQTSEGRLVPDGSSGYNYKYAIKDLPIAIGIGNTRVMFDETGQVLQDQSYYPFGMSMGDALTFDMPSELPDNKYLYNGKELQDDFGLDWYDYGARFYDAALGRWSVIDPLLDKFYSYSPYNYGLNNTIRFIDQDGKASGDPPYLYATEGAAINGKAIHKTYTNLPTDVKRTVSGAVKIVFGLAQFLGGAVFGTVTSPSIAGGIAGGATTMFGGVISNGQAYFIGNNSEKRLHDIQNWIHRGNLRKYTGVGPISTPYFYDHQLKSKVYSYYGNYHSNYLFY